MTNGRKSNVVAQDGCSCTRWYISEHAQKPRSMLAISNKPQVYMTGGF